MSTPDNPFEAPVKPDKRRRDVGLGIVFHVCSIITLLGFATLVSVLGGGAELLIFPLMLAMTVGFWQLIITAPILLVAITMKRSGIAQGAAASSGVLFLLNSIGCLGLMGIGMAG